MKMNIQETYKTLTGYNKIAIYVESLGTQKLWWTQSRKFIQLHLSKNVLEISVIKNHLDQDENNKNKRKCYSLFEMFLYYFAERCSVNEKGYIHILIDSFIICRVLT